LNKIRTLIIIIGVVGALVFGSAFTASLLNPAYVEKIASQVIRHQVEKKVKEKIDAIDATFLAGYAQNLFKDYTLKIATAKRLLAQGLPEKIANVIAEMQNLDCECRQKIEKSIRDGFEWQITSASQAQERLSTLIRTKYMQTAELLTREFRIFTGTNALVFALLAIAALVKRRAGLHLLPAALVLLSAAGITACLYLLNQNWLHTILFSDYVGLGYIAYLGLAFACLSDILFNHARITAKLLSQFFNVIGSATTIVPC